MHQWLYTSLTFCAVHTSLTVLCPVPVSVLSTYVWRMVPFYNACCRAAHIFWPCWIMVPLMLVRVRTFLRATKFSMTSSLACVMCTGMLPLLLTSTFNIQSQFQSTVTVSRVCVLIERNCVYVYVRLCYGLQGLN